MCNNFLNGVGWSSHSIIGAFRENEDLGWTVSLHPQNVLLWREVDSEREIEEFG